MEVNSFKKDETPYFVFTCSKCKNYSYVKTMQKGKKCLRCGKNYKVKNLESISEIVHGITAAKDRVIELQNELVQKELNSSLDLHAQNGFIFSFSDNRITQIRNKKITKISEIQEFDEVFNEVLLDLREKYKQFPLYLIEIAAMDRGIPKEEVKFLIPRFIKNSTLVRTRNNLFQYGSF